MSEEIKNTVTTEEVVEAPKAEKVKGPAPKTGHTKAWAKRRAKEKARRRAARKNRK